MSSEIFVKMIAPDKQGQPRACILRGSSAQKAVLLEEFSEEIRSLLNGKVQDTTIRCQPSENPTPQTIKPAPGATALSPKPTNFSAAQHAQPQSTRPQSSSKHHGFGHGHSSGHKSGNSGGNPHPGNPGPTHIPDSPFDQHNPYNFAEWEGKTPWPAEEPEGGSHEGWREKRKSGVLTVKLMAVTPIFIPEGRATKDPPRPEKFWSCGVTGSDQPRYGIPGSTLKGVVRTLFETWTNSRLSLLSEENYQRPIPYRRRCSTAWVISEKKSDGSFSVCQCATRFAKRVNGNSWQYGVQQGPQLVVQSWTDPSDIKCVNSVDASDKTNWQAVEFRANLYWVPKVRHKHARWTHLVVQVSPTTATIPSQAVNAYRENLKHRSFKEHWQCVKDIPPGGPGRNCYVNINKERVETEKGCLNNYNHLYRLEVGDLVFAMVDPLNPNHILCFGKNVNFLWPSRLAPKDLVGAYWPSSELLLKKADTTEAAFGYAAPHQQREGGVVSHPFRGRIRFETFWAEGTPTPMDLTLKKLMSPPRVKLKARPLYLPADEKTNRSSTYNEVARFRGRKFYWHQGVSSGRIAPAQLGEEVNLDDPRILALPAKTTFEGKIHFDNLTEKELGALLVSVCPNLFWQEGNQGSKKDRQYGLKIGKGKPRGMGSVLSKITKLELRRDSKQAYISLEAKPLAEENDKQAYVSLFKSKLAEGLGFVNDLEHLLRLPSKDVSRLYREPRDYGWQPNFNDAHGDPAGGPLNRKPAMRRARDIDVP